MKIDKRVYAYCTAQSYQMDLLYDFLKDKYKISLVRDVIVVESDNKNLAFIFSYGVCVLWNFDYESEKRLLENISKFAQMPIEDKIEEHFSYHIDEKVTLSIKHDIIILPQSSTLFYLSLSHALAQSIKLSWFETSIAKVIEQTRYISESMANNGKIPLSRREITKERGRIFSQKSKILLQYDLLDTPEFIWENPELEIFYLQFARYFEVKPRVELLNKKFEILQEIMEMLADEQNHQHSSMLEWIIIVLILIEIILVFFH